MFVCETPRRIIASAQIEIVCGKTEIIGKDGVACRVTCDGDGVVVTEENKVDRTSGYHIAAGEILEFLGKAGFYNGASEAVCVSVIESDIV